MKLKHYLLVCIYISAELLLVTKKVKREQKTLSTTNSTANDHLKSKNRDGVTIGNARIYK